MAPALVFVVAIAFIALSLRLRTPRRVTRVFRVLGLATYPFYLLHDVTGAAIVRVLLDAGFGRWEALGASLAIVFAASVLISQRVEPAIRSALSARAARSHGGAHHNGRLFVRAANLSSLRGRPRLSRPRRAEVAVEVGPPVTEEAPGGAVAR